MVIEDIPVFDWTNTIKATLPTHLTNNSYPVDLRPINNRWDDIMLIIKA
jgi:hypothetical protein